MANGEQLVFGYWQLQSADIFQIPMVIDVASSRPAELLSATFHARVAAALRDLPCTGEKHRASSSVSSSPNSSGFAMALIPLHGNNSDVERVILLVENIISYPLSPCLLLVFGHMYV
jgi:hypothetical protein